MPPRTTAGVAEAIALAMGSLGTLSRDPPYFSPSRSETPSPGPPQLYYNSDEMARIRARAVREIQEDEDRRIVELLVQHAEASRELSLQRVRLDQENFRAVFDLIDQQQTPTPGSILSRQDYEDILALYDPSEQHRILPAPDFLENGFLPGELAQIHGLPGAFTVQESVGTAVINPRGAELLAARRVQIPEFEIQSGPSIRIDEIRTRRFDLIERSVHLEPIVQRILDAVVRAKSAPEPKPFRQSSGSPRSVWEALVDLDLVDAGSS